jgi:phage major head subunit gpT-like protein
MAHVAANWAELLTPQTTEAFFTGFTAGGRRTSMVPSIFRVETSQRAFEEHLGVGQFGSDGWNFEDSGRVQYDTRNKGYLTRFTPVEFAKGFIVERKLVDDNMFSVVFDQATELGDAAFRQREKAAANVFANSFTDSGFDKENFPIAGADAVGLCSLVHPANPTSTSDTQANEGVLTFTKDNVQATRQLMLAYKDDRGDILDVMPDRILIPPELEDAGLEIVRSVQDPTSANNAVNPNQGRFSLEIWHYLDDATNWFMIDSGRRARDLIWYNRIAVEFDREPDFDTLQTKFRAYMRYTRGWRDWRWIFGQQAPGS